MTRSMTRLALAGCMALAAISAVAVLDVGSSTAEAAPSVSPFTGAYAWSGWGPVAISSGGRITSSWGSPSSAAGSISGRVSSDGSYAFTMSVSYPKDPRNGDDGHKVTSTHAGTMALDANGNIVGTPDTGASFTWLLR